MYLKIAVSVAAVGCFAAFTWLAGGDSDFGATAAFSVFAIVFAASVRWDMRTKWYYQAALALVSIAHVVFVLRAHLVLPKPTMSIAPLVIVDALLIVMLLGALDRSLTAHGDDKHQSGYLLPASLLRHSGQAMSDDVADLGPNYMMDPISED